MGKAPSTWKKIELNVARYINGWRNPVSGRTRGDVADVENGWLAVEVKYKQKPGIPAWLHDAMDQAVKSAKPRQMPCVVLAEKGSNIGDYYIIFKLSDAKDHWL